MILPKQVKVHKKTIDSNQNKIPSQTSQIARCRYSFNNSTSYNSNGEAIEYKGSLHVKAKLKDEDLVTFDGQTFYELSEIKETVDLNNNLLFTYCKLRETNYNLFGTNS